jgi:serine/threonine-protein kinase
VRISVDLKRLAGPAAPPLRLATGGVGGVIGAGGAPCTVWEACPGAAAGGLVAAMADRAADGEGAGMGANDVSSRLGSGLLTGTESAAEETDAPCEGTACAGAGVDNVTAAGREWTTHVPHSLQKRASTGTWAWQRAQRDTGPRAYITSARTTRKRAGAARPERERPGPAPRASVDAVQPADSQRCPTCGRLSTSGYATCPWCGGAMPGSAAQGAADAASPRGAQDVQVDFGWAVAVLDKQLGEGGMGVVYHAWLYPRGAGGVQPPMEAAVKILHPTFSHQDRMRELFGNEARVLASLAHPNVVRFFGTAELNGASAIAMEYVPGETLGHLVERKVKQAAEARARAIAGGAGASTTVRMLPSLPFDRAWHYFQQLLGALAAIHALGVVHRDVKPDNVLLRTDGVAKLTDFGIARMAADVQKATGNVVAGTVAYMSPEQVQGNALDSRSDLYSAGVVLFELLTGRLPFAPDERSDWMIAVDHVNTPPPPLRKFLPQAPIELEMLVARSLAKRPEDRFQTAVAFGDAFRTTLGLPIDRGWHAQQIMAHQAGRFATAMALGEALESPELRQARAEVANAYRPG